MAYNAVVLLKETIRDLLSSSEIPMPGSVRDTVEFALREVDSVQEAVHDRLDSGTEWADELDCQIEEAAHEFIEILEDIDESIVEEKDACRKLSQGMEEVWRKIYSYAETAKEKEEEYFKEIYSASLPQEEEEEDDDEDAAVSSSEEMVGFCDEFKEMKHRLLEGIRPDEFGVVSIVGTPGSGRTFAARSIFHDFYVENGESLDCVVWVNVGMKYQFEEILQNIVEQIDDDHKFPSAEKKLAEYLWTYLESRKYLIVFDDIRDVLVWEDLRRLFPEKDNGSLVLLTTGVMEVALSAHSFYTYEMPVLGEEESWSSFRFGLFGAQACPAQLEEAGRKIVKNCRGLRMALAKVMILVCKAEKTSEYWNELAADEGNPVFMVGDDELLEMTNIQRDIRHQLCSLPLEDYETTTIELAATVLDFTIPTDKIKKVMFPNCNSKTENYVLYGMTGIGKTIFVKKMFDDATIRRYYNCCVWVTLGPDYNPKELLGDIIAQIYPEIDKTDIRGIMKLVKKLRVQLSCKRFLIVLDDLWNTEALNYLYHFLPNFKGRVLATTREEEVESLNEDVIFVKHKMRLLNKDESWCLFRRKVFGEEFCPLELEKIGKRIANKCGGLPLFIVTVAYLLSKAEKTQEWWNEVARFQR